MANRFSFADTSGFQGYYNQLQARAAREEQERQRKKLEEQRRKASKHAGFGQALSTVASLGGAALGAGLTGGSMTGAMAGYSLGNAAAGGLMSLFPNIGGTEPSGDNPYYDKPSDLARLNSVVGAGLQGYGMIQQQMKQDAAQNFAGFTNTFIRNNPGSTEEEIYNALKGKDSPYEEAKGLFGESLLNDQSLRQVARDAFQRKADMALTLYNQALQLPDVAQKKNVVQNWHNTFGKAHSDLIMPGSNEAIQAAISQNLSAQEAANVLHAWIQEQGGNPLKTMELNADLQLYVQNKAAGGPGFENYVRSAKPFIKTFHELNPAAQTAVLAAIQDTTKQQSLALAKTLGETAAKARDNAFNETKTFANSVESEFKSLRSDTDEMFRKEYTKNEIYARLFTVDENGQPTETLNPEFTEEAFLTIAYANKPGQDEAIAKALRYKFNNPTRFEEAYSNVGLADVFKSLKGNEKTREYVTVEGAANTKDAATTSNVSEQALNTNNTSGTGSETTTTTTSVQGRGLSDAGIYDLPRPSKPRQDEDLYKLFDTAQTRREKEDIAKQLQERQQARDAQALKETGEAIVTGVETAGTAVADAAESAADFVQKSFTVPRPYKDLSIAELNTEIRTTTQQIETIRRNEGVDDTDPELRAKLEPMYLNLGELKRELNNRQNPSSLSSTLDFAKEKLGGIYDATSEALDKARLTPGLDEGSKKVAEGTNTAVRGKNLYFPSDRGAVREEARNQSEQIPRYMSKDLVDIPTNTPPAINTAPTDPINEDAQRIQVPRYMSEEAYADPSRSFDVPINPAPTTPLPRLDGVLEAQETLEEREAAQQQLKEQILEAAEANDLSVRDAALILALESDLGKTSNNISQIKGAALKEVEKKLGRKLDPKDPEDNILAGVTYFKMIQKPGDSFTDTYIRYIFGPTGGEDVLKAKDNELISKVISSAAYNNNSGWLSSDGQSLTIKQVKDKIEKRIEAKEQEIASSLGLAVATSVPELKPTPQTDTSPASNAASSGLASSIYQVQLDQGPTEATTPSYKVEYIVGDQTFTSREDAERLVRIQEDKARAALEAQNALNRKAEEQEYKANREIIVDQQIRRGQIIKLEEVINDLIANPIMNNYLPQKSELQYASSLIDAYRRKENPTREDEMALDRAVRHYEKVRLFFESLQGE